MANKETKLNIIIQAVDKTEAAFSSIKNNMDAVKTRSESTISAMKTVGTVGAVGFAAAAAAVTSFVKAGADLEQTTIAFSTMLGSMDKAKSLMSDIQTFAAKTPFELPDLLGATRSLLAYGVQSKDVQKTLQQIGDVAAGTNQPIGEMATLFGKMKSQQVIFTEDLNQLANRGIPILDMLAAKYKTNVAGVREMAASGKLSFADIEMAFGQMTGKGGIFFNMMDNQSNTLNGRLSTLSDAFGEVSRQIGTALLPLVKQFTDFLIPVVEKIGAWVAEHPKLAAGIAIVVLALTGIMAVLLPLAFILPTLAAGFAMMGTVLGAFSIAGLAAAAPIIAIGVAIAGVIYILYSLYTNWDLIWTNMQLTIANVVNAIVDMIEAMVNKIIDGINVVINTINSLIAKLAKVPKIGSMFKGMKIDTLDAVDFKGVDTGAIIDKYQNNKQGVTNNVIVTNNTLLDENASTKIGDMIMGKLKMSNSI